MTTSHDDPAGNTGHTRPDIREKASEAAAAARDHAAERADSAKNSVAREVDDVASALRTAADQLRSGTPQARTFGRMAEGLADASESLRDKDLVEMTHELNDFARRNPLAFLGGAALLGFAATRFARATAANDDSEMPETTAPPPAPASSAATPSVSGVPSDMGGPR